MLPICSLVKSRALSAVVMPALLVGVPFALSSCSSIGLGERGEAVKKFNEPDFQEDLKNAIETALKTDYSGTRFIGAYQIVPQLTKSGEFSGKVMIWGTREYGKDQSGYIYDRGWEATVDKRTFKVTGLKGSTRPHRGVSICNPW